MVTQTVLGSPATYDSCTMYDVDYEEVLRDGLSPNETWPTKSCDNGWDYDLEHIRYPSAVTEVSRELFQFKKTKSFLKISSGL